METCNAVGCFKPRHKSTGGFEYAYCYDHWLQRMEERKWDDQPERKDEMPRTKSDVCVVEGCDQPRMRNKQGEMLTMCDEHQHAKWREYSAKQQAKKSPRPRATQPPKSVGEFVDGEPEASPVGTVLEVFPKEAGEKFQRVAVALTPIKHDCEHCTAKATIEALRAKSPKLARLIDAMQAEVEAAQELGL